MAGPQDDAFGPLREVARLLSGFGRPWFVAGGWAVDLFLGRGTREHKDIEIAIFRRDQRALRRHLGAWEFARARPAEGGRLVPWVETEWLDLPEHEIHASRSSGTLRRLEILLDEGTEQAWVYRRNAKVTRPLSRVSMRGPGRIPFLAPEIVLLYKSKGPRPRDDEDFRIVRGRLHPEQRAWLRDAIRASHPESPWLSDL